MSDSSLVVTVEAGRRLSGATEHAHHPLVQSLKVRNDGARTLEQVELRLTVEPSCGPGWSTTIAQLPAGQSFHVDRPRLVFSPQALDNVQEARPGLIRATARAGDVDTSLETPITLLPAHHWPGSDAPLELLACFVLPNDPALHPILKSAARHLERATGRRSLSGYQAGLRQESFDQVQAVWLALVELGLAYLSPPPSFERSGQRVMCPGDIFRAGAGACLDLSALFAAIAERCGLHAALVVIRGHAFVGIWLEPSPYREAIHDSAVAARKAVDSGELLVLETTLLAHGAPLDVAREAARKRLDAPEPFEFLLDIQAARSEGFEPLAFIPDLPSATEEEDAPRPTQWTQASVPEREHPATEGTEATVDRLTAWKEKLLDLSLRNRLLNFRPGKRTVSLRIPDLGAVEDWLASGHPVPLYHRPKLRHPDDATRLDALAQTHAGRQEILADHTELDLSGRLLELLRLGRSSLQETGAVTTYLALGMLRWQDKKSPEKTRHAPLLLVPVHLRRGSGNRPYTIVLAEEADPQLNVTLLTLLRRDYQLQHPGLDSGTLPEDQSGIDVPLLIRRFRELVRTQSDWEVEDRAVLASLTFTKFLMYKDLVASSDVLMESEVVRRIFDGTSGTFGLQAPLLEEPALDSALAPTDVLPVLPADPSQLAAVAACADGSSYVLQGPPGTGKSQTITNLIADTLARGQTVLFVAEKKAAIDVVHRRLHQVGLGPFTFELHSDKASKKQALEQVREAMGQLEPSAPADWQTTAAELTALRAQLNAFAEAMRAPSCLGEATYVVLGQLIELNRAATLPLAFPALDATAAHSHETALQQAIHVIQSTGGVVDSPWQHARRTFAPPQLRQTLAANLQQLEDAAASLSQAGQALGPSWWTDGPTAHRQALTDLARTSAQAGKIPDGLRTTPNIEETEAQLRALADQTQNRAELWAPLAPQWDPSLLSDAPTRTRLLQRFEKWTEVFLLGWVVLFFTRAQVRRWLNGTLPGHQAIRDQLRRLDQTAAADARLAAADTRARACIGPHWRRADTDWDSVWAHWAHAKDLRRALGAVPPQIAQSVTPILHTRAEQLVDGAPLSRALESFVAANAACNRALATLRTTLEMEDGGLASLPLSALPAWIQRARSSGYSGLRSWCAWQTARAELESLQLSAVVNAIETGTVATEGLLDALRRAHRTEAWLQACHEHPALSRFSGVTHDAVISRFRAVDRRWEALSQGLVRARVAARMPDPNAPGEMATIRRQLGLKRRHMSLRRLFQEVPTTLRALKPCVLMSPLSVARYLDPGGEPFDLVLFDEASQIPPWDAIGAIARGRRCIVVGDSRQLPPTTFFSRGDSDEDEIDEDRITDMESILEEAVSSGLQELRLQWHYRSRHESLITFSNRTYYDNHLLTFPAAEHDNPQLGVKLISVPEGHYDRGGSRTNAAEAERIVRWLSKWARRPEHSRGTVGVVTFNMAQQRRIEDLLDHHARTDPQLEAALSAGDEPPFVKNLENVQGDERDTILFSICYGPDASGRVAMNFGPLNKRGGERRLNVAITRARRQLRVYATLRHDQIQLSRTRAVGVRHLRTFLDFAARGVVALEASTPTTPVHPQAAPLEAELRSAVEALGWTVERNIGCSGYRIGLAVKDPTQPGRFILAVEWDGASYHSAKSARARDRQRQEVLEGLGWRFHRVWSTEWLHDRAGELRRLESALQSALRAQQEADARASTPQPPSDTTTDPTAEEVPAADESPAGSGDSTPPAVPPAPPKATQRPTFCLPTPAIGSEETLRSPMHTQHAAEWLQHLVDSVGPVHQDTAYRWLVRSALPGAPERVRLGSRLKQDCARVTEHLVRKASIERHGDFLWPRDARTTWTAWRRAGSRSAEQVAPEEVRNAAAEILQGALSITRDELVRATATTLGYARLTRKTKARMNTGIDLLLADTGAELVEGSVRLTRQSSSRTEGAGSPPVSGGAVATQPRTDP